MLESQQANVESGLIKNAKPPGSMIEELTEEIDIFPSLVDLYGYEVPSYLQVW